MNAYGGLQNRTEMCYHANRHKGGDKMKKYKLIVRSQICMGRPVTDYDRKTLDCYYETPVFYANSNAGDMRIIEAAYELFCVRNLACCYAESVELMCVA